MPESKQQVNSIQNRDKYKVVVLLSGRGSNLIALHKHILKNSLNIEISLVISDQEKAEGLTYAKNSNLNTVVIKREAKTKSVTEFNSELAKAAASVKPDLVVLAGFMRILTPEFINPFETKLINIHPSLLPAFRGLNAQQQALEAKVKFTGCTVHIATIELDAGPIIAQAVVPVFDNDTVEILSERILKQEHNLLPKVVQGFCEGKITVIRNSKNQLRLTNNIVSSLDSDISLIS